MPLQDLTWAGWLDAVFGRLVSLILKNIYIYLQDIPLLILQVCEIEMSDLN